MLLRQEGKWGQAICPLHFTHTHTHTQTQGLEGTTIEVVYVSRVVLEHIKDIKCYCCHKCPKLVSSTLT